ncbi:Disintegrin and metalloproteinase domain-containing protein 20 [Fukomys damarensis]|uniref:Disintegrin and metalloproteinase domain-containing protein 20 n=2 Tax=Fukomys damarensis TaxID=885580 RepID=A0A091E6V0_FUKDA|nr:Disintegrin and metalloproteinase domain-containing protein 20 [Fukomys damarensis]
MKVILLLLWIWVFSFLLTWPHSGHSQYFNPPEVVKLLRIIGTSRGTKATNWVSYSLHLNGRRHIIHMKVKKLLMDKHLSVFTYSDQGALQEDQTFIPNNCYYHGYVEGDPTSLVALSTCFGGFRGMLHINNTSYEIKPQNHSITFEHLAYKMYPEETKSQPFRCRLREEDTEKGWQMKLKENNHSALRQSSYKGWYVHQWYSEVGFVVDKGRFLFRQSNVSQVNMDIISCVNLVDSYFKTMGVNIVIMAVEIWTDQNPISANNIEEMRESFCSWKNRGFHQRVPNDATNLVFKQDICGNSICSATQMGICSAVKNCGVECHTDDNLLQFATTTAHVLGHLMGFTHTSQYCACGEDRCIMDSSVQIAHAFSNCSYAALMQTVLASGKCMYNKPQKTFKYTFCGNNVVEEGEVCDCGTTKSCANDSCCLENCVLSQGSVCASGLCCKGCQFQASGTVCREQVNECDLPEWCDGNSALCPEDVYVEDGLPCLGKGFCYERRCNNRNYQCKAIFGEDAKNAQLGCYEEMNMRGDRFGHCRRGKQTYIACNDSDYLCGRIQCDNVPKLPELRDHDTLIWTHLNPLTCWSIDYHFGMSTPDIGAVYNGTECGAGKFCIEGKCISIPIWINACLPDACHGRGICNNKHHCHCDYDWAPPTCEVGGDGGSVDSGPPPAKKRTYAFNVLQKKGPQLVLFTSILALILFLLILLLLLHKKLRKKDEENVPAPPEAEKQAPPEEAGQKVQAPPGEAGQNVQATSGEAAQNVQAPPGETAQNVQAPPGEARKKASSPAGGATPKVQ